MFFQTVFFEPIADQAEKDDQEKYNWQEGIWMQVKKLKGSHKCIGKVNTEYNLFFGAVFRRESVNSIQAIAIK